MILSLIASRFPPPQFESGHQLPVLTGFPPRALTFEYIDVGVLALTLMLASWLALRSRSRSGLVALGIFSLLYFGFWRKGCVCAIGSIQNITQALFQSSYAVPLTVVAFGLLPLVFALFFGRVFCSSVCPHGALQDLMLIKPITVPPWLEHALRLIPYTYLGVAMVFAATGGGYIICQYDPFVPLFRINGSFAMIMFGVALLVLGMFVGRPYCRFLCPYGVLLGLASKVSKWCVHITPDACTQCRLCEQSCPFNAINKSTVDAPARSQTSDRRRLVAAIMVLPVLLLVGVWLGGLTGQTMARKHPRVNLAERIHLEESGAVAGSTDASTALRNAGTPLEQLYDEALALRSRYILAGRLCGAWICLVVGLKLISLAVHRRREEYEADQARCLACARCFKYCPEELKRRGLPVPVAVSLVTANER